MEIEQKISFRWAVCFGIFLYKRYTNIYRVRTTRENNLKSYLYKIKSLLLKCVTVCFGTLKYEDISKTFWK